jgi:hypothetical protein
MEHILEQKNHYIRPGPATAITFSTPPHGCLQLAHKHLSIGLCLGSNLCYPHVSILVTCRLRLHTLGVVRLTLLNLNITGVSLGLSSDLSWSRISICVSLQVNANIPLVWCASRSSTSTSRALALALAAICAVCVLVLCTATRVRSAYPWCGGLLAPRHHEHWLWP